MAAAGCGHRAAREGAQRLHCTTSITGRRSSKAGRIPAELVIQNSAFVPEMIGVDPPLGIYSHIIGVDLVRTGENEFYVLEDNTRTPSGVSYMLENRETMMHMFPNLFAENRVAPVETYPDNLRKTLESVAPESSEGDPVIAVLTPGLYNSAYFEHAFLADQMGVELVESVDLVVMDGYLNMKTTQGLTRVDVLYRRVDDDFLDPLNFNPKSVLGVPGLFDVYRAGNVTIVNAPGAGIADDKAIYSYIPEIIEFYMGRRADPEQRADLQLPQAGQRSNTCSSIARARREGSARLGRLRHAGRPRGHEEEIETFRAKLKARARELHRPADAGAFHLPDTRRRRHRAEASGPQALRPHRRRGASRAWGA